MYYFRMTLYKHNTVHTVPVSKDDSRPHTLAHPHPIAVVQLLVLGGTERVQAASSQPALGRYHASLETRLLVVCTNYIKYTTSSVSDVIFCSDQQYRRITLL